jgi:DNA-binding transcriptional MerR regulator/effector-binding domain-containing protein
MYRIGPFSQMCKVTVKALRFYEAEGLLEPAWIDPATGYRHYDSTQLLEVHRIAALRQCGLSIPEIKQVLTGRRTAEVFERRRRQLERELEQTSRQLGAIRHYQDQLAGGSSRVPEILIKDLPRVTVYSKRFTAPDYDSYFRLIPAIGAEVAAANPGLRCKDNPAYCFIVYHDGEFRETDLDIELCEAVWEAGRDSGDIHFKVVEAVPQAACALHQGPYSSLGASYATLFDWIERNGWEADGPTRESAIDGIWNQDDPADWLTEVQVPVRRRIHG